MPAIDTAEHFTSDNSSSWLRAHPHMSSGYYTSHSSSLLCVLTIFALALLSSGAAHKLFTTASGAFVSVSLLLARHFCLISPEDAVLTLKTELECDVPEQGCAENPNYTESSRGIDRSGMIITPLLVLVPLLCFDIARETLVKPCRQELNVWQIARKILCNLPHASPNG